MFSAVFDIFLIVVGSVFYIFALTLLLKRKEF